MKLNILGSEIVKKITPSFMCFYQYTKGRFLKNSGKERHVKEEDE